MILALVLGCVIGFVSAVPVAGPVSAIIFSYGMRKQYVQGRSIALGAGLGEAAYTFLAFWGFTQVFAKYENWILVSQAVAAGVLGVLGVYFYRSKKMRHPEAATAPAPGKSRRTKRSFFIGLGISAANPSLIATWTAAITTLYHFHLFEFTPLTEGSFSVGVWVGIYLWFALSLQLMARHRNRIHTGLLDRMLKSVGVVLVGLAGWMVYRLTQIG